MKKLSNHYKVLLGIAAVIAAAGIISHSIVEQRLQNQELLLSVKVTEQKALLATIAETTARNGADSVTEQIVIDCPLNERSRHDQLLSQLDQGLTRAELLELDQLFTGCGSFYAERKAVMVARLEREIFVYTDYVALLSSVTGRDEAESYSLNKWQELIEGEQSQSVLFAELVRQQQAIIDALLVGNTASSQAIQDILVEVQETREALLLAKTQTDSLRAQLTTL